MSTLHNNKKIRLILSQKSEIGKNFVVKNQPKLKFYNSKWIWGTKFIALPNFILLAKNQAPPQITYEFRTLFFLRILKIHANLEKIVKSRGYSQTQKMTKRYTDSQKHESTLLHT